MTKMAKAESTAPNMESLNVEFMRSLVKQYSELGQWTSALFWADASAATGSALGEVSGDDIWLLASSMLARGELHRAAYAVTSRGLHKKHLLCLGVAMRAHLAAKEPTAALNLCDECDPYVLEPKIGDRIHNRALAAVLVTQGRALAALERREAAAEALTAALHCDCACYEALHLLLEQQALQTSQEKELVDTLPYNVQLKPIEGAFLKAAYRQRLRPYSSEPIADPAPSDPTSLEISRIQSRTSEGTISRARRLTATCEWAAALKLLDSVDPWCAPEIRTACLVELKKSSELFAFAHTLVDAYPNSWTAWYAVGCYYYLIGKNEFARRYLSKAKSLDPGAGCVWLAYGHSFSADKEHDQAMAAYFKASQLMSGCHLPFLYVAVECSSLHNMSMCERFLLKAANVHNGDESASEPSELSSNTWEQLAMTVTEPHIAHEAGVCAFAHGNYTLAITLLKQALKHAGPADNLNPRWASTLDALGHCYRHVERVTQAATWHRRALALRPSPAAPRAALALCAARRGCQQEAAELLHSVLAKDPDDVVCAALLDSVVDSMHSNFDDEEIPNLAFPPVKLSPPPAPPAAPGPPAAPSTPAAPQHDATNHSDMSMSFEASLDFD